MTPTRQLAAFSCRGCGANLVTHEPAKTVACPFCETDVKMPKRLRDDLELGRKLPADFAKEVGAAIDAVVEERFEPPEIPAWLFLVVLALGAALGALAWLDADWWWGAIGGGLALALPLGWLGGWFAALRRERASELAREDLIATPLACPSCERPTRRPEVPGRADCADCKASLALTPEAVVLDDKGRKKAWRAAIEGVVESAEWIRAGRFVRFEVAMMLGVELTIVAIGAGTWWLLR